MIFSITVKKCTKYTILEQLQQTPYLSPNSKNRGQKQKTHASRPPTQPPTLGGHPNAPLRPLHLRVEKGAPTRGVVRFLLARTNGSRKLPVRRSPSPCCSSSAAPGPRAPTAAAQSRLLPSKSSAGGGRRLDLRPPPPPAGLLLAARSSAPLPLHEVRGYPTVSAIKPYEGFGDVDHAIKELMSV
jgi:hypothetical protein